MRSTPSGSGACCGRWGWRRFTRSPTPGVIKSDAGIEFHVNFCHPNPMKPAMPTLDEKDIVLLQRIKRHPLLRARVESLLGVVEDAGGDLEKADAAERRVIEELRQMGNEVLTEWARGGAIKSDARLATSRLCCLFFDATPIVVIFPIRPVEAQRQHGFDIRGCPPGTGQLEPFLDHIAVRAFDFPRADGQALF